MSIGQGCEALTRNRILATIEQAATPESSFPGASGKYHGL